jgi:hypothetical protein
MTETCSEANRQNYIKSMTGSQDLDIIDSSNISLDNSTAAQLKASIGSNEP